MSFGDSVNGGGRGRLPELFINIRKDDGKHTYVEVMA